MANEENGASEKTSGDKAEAPISRTVLAPFSESLTVSVLSDKRLKENFEICDASFLPFTQGFSSTKPYTLSYMYNFKDKPDRKRVGLIAQEVRDICPEAVEEGEDGFLSIDQGAVLGICVHDLVRLANEVASLKATLSKLDRMFCNYRKKVDEACHV